MRPTSQKQSYWKLAGLLSLGLYASLGTGQGAYAQGGGSNGSIGGGNGVYVNGVLRLRDLVDPGTCRWQSGEAILNDNEELRAQLEKNQKPELVFSHDVGA